MSKAHAKAKRRKCDRLILLIHSWIHEEWSQDERNEDWSFDEWNDDRSFV